MDDLINSGAEAVSDPDGALMVVSAINSIIGGNFPSRLVSYVTCHPRIFSQSPSYVTLKLVQHSAQKIHSFITFNDSCKLP